MGYPSHVWRLWPGLMGCLYGVSIAKETNPINLSRGADRPIDAGAHTDRGAVERAQFTGSRAGLTRFLRGLTDRSVPTGSHQLRGLTAGVRHTSQSPLSHPETHRSVTS